MQQITSKGIRDLIYSESDLSRRVFSQLLPPYASRAGYFEGVSPEGLFPEGIYPIPVHLAPAASLDGIWVDSSHAPENSREMAALLQTLGPGGIGVLFLKTAHWNRRAIRDFCRGAGMQLLFVSPIPSRGRIKLTPAGIPIPRNVLRRFALRFVTFFFPSLAGLFGSELFVIVQKSAVRHREADGTRLSIIVPAGDADRLKQWEEFIAKHRVHEVELIAVEEDAEAAPPAGSTIHIQHYRKAGRAAAIRSGLLHSRGKAALLDNDRRCPPDFLFDLMLARIQAKDKVDVVAGLDSLRRSWWLRRIINRWLTGFSDPEPVYLLLSDRAIRDLIDMHPEQWNGYPYAAGLRLRSRMRIEEVNLIFDPPLPPRKIANASIVSYLVYRLRRSAIFMLLPVLLSLLFSLAAAFPSGRIAQELTGMQAIPSAVLDKMKSLHALQLPLQATLLRSMDHVIQPELRRELAARFFFVLAVGFLIHFWNVVVVFRRPSGSLLPWIMAQAEALLMLFLFLEFQASAFFFSAISDETWRNQTFLSAFYVSRLIFFAFYAFLFRYRT